MGEVYRGFNIQTADIVAIKMIRPEFSDNDEVMELFRREASILHNLVHEAIVRYFLFSVDPVIGRAYLAMEFVDGPSLSDRLTSGPLSLPERHHLAKDESPPRWRRRTASASFIAIFRRTTSFFPTPMCATPRSSTSASPARLEVGKKTIIGSGFAGKYNYVSPEQLGMTGGDVTVEVRHLQPWPGAGGGCARPALDMSGSAGGSDRQAPGRAGPFGYRSRRSGRCLQAMLQPLPENRPASMAAVAEWTGSAAPAPPAEAGQRSEASLRDWPATAAQLRRRPPAGVSPPSSAPSSRSRASAASLSSSRTISRQWTPRSRPRPAYPAPGPPRRLRRYLRFLQNRQQKPHARPPKPRPRAQSCRRLRRPQRPQTPPPAAASPPAEAEQTASLPPAETPSAAAEPAAVANPPAQRVPSAADILQRRAAPRAAGGDRPAGGDRRSALPNRASRVSPTTAARTFVCRPNQVPDGLSFRDLGEGKGLIEGAPAHAGGATMRVDAVNPRRPERADDGDPRHRGQAAAGARRKADDGARGSTSRAHRRADGAAGGSAAVAPSRQPGSGHGRSGLQRRSACVQRRRGRGADDAACRPGPPRRAGLRGPRLRP